MRTKRAFKQPVWQVFAQVDVEAGKGLASCVKMQIEAEGVAKGVWGAYQF